MNEDLTHDEWAELMAEPPHGENFGRVRNNNGGWTNLDIPRGRAFADGMTIDPEPRVYRRHKKPKSTVRHGTVSAYTTDRCRCEFCRIAWAAYTKDARRV